MSASSIPKVNYSQGLMTVLPLFYVGWADGILSPGESQKIREKIDSFEFLTPEEKATALSWSEPTNPPQDETYQEWQKIILKYCKDTSEDEKNSLIDLGLTLAKNCDDCSDPTYWANDQTKTALLELQNIMGVHNVEINQHLSKQEVVSPAADFDVAQMTLALDKEYTEYKAKIKTLLSYPSFTLQNIPEKGAYREHILEQTRALADQGLGALAFAPAYGGEDDMGKYAAMFDVLGYHDLSLAIKFGVQFGLFGGSINWLGTKYHHDKYLKDTGTLDLAGCFAMTETGHGSNVRGLQTTATYDPASDEIIIHTPTEADGKEYIGNAMHSKMASVFAQLIVNGERHGVHAILVPLRDADHKELPGIRIADCGYKIGLNGVDNGRIWFDQVRVPRLNLLNRFGDIDEHGNYSSPISNPMRRFFTMLGTLVGGRVCVPRAGLSAAKTGLAIAIKHSLKRRQFEQKPGEAETLLLDYPSHQRRLMPYLAKSYAISFGLDYLTERFVKRSEKDIREIESLAAGMKAYATWFTTASLQECREACGGKGYLSENRLGQLKADTEIFTTFEGDNTVLMQLVSKGLLSNFSKEFHDDGFVAVLRMLGNQFSTLIMEQNPYTKRKSSSDYLLSGHFQLAAFKYREQKLLYTVSQRMRGLIKNKMNSTDAFLRCQTHLLSLANAFVERTILEQFIKQAKQVKDQNTKLMLKQLTQLYALHTIESHKDFYLETEYMSPTKTKAIRRLVDQLCKETRNHAEALVDAFAIPKEILQAPIAV